MPINFYHEVHVTFNTMSGEFEVKTNPNVNVIVEKRNKNLEKIRSQKWIKQTRLTNSFLMIPPNIYTQHISLNIFCSPFHL